MANQTLMVNAVSIDALWTIVVEQAQTSRIQEIENRLADVDRQIEQQQQLIRALQAADQDVSRSVELLQDLDELREMLHVHKARLLPTLEQ